MVQGRSSSSLACRNLTTFSILNPETILSMVHSAARTPQRCGCGDQIGSADQYQTPLPLYPFAGWGRSYGTVKSCCGSCLQASPVTFRHPKNCCGEAM